MELFKEQSCDAKTNAQRNLCGRTHYVDDDTLRWHKSRVLSARTAANGLLFAITTSDALDMNNTKRGFRYVIFDIFGTVLGRNELQDSFKRHEQAIKAMWTAINQIDAHTHTLNAIEDSRVTYTKELDRLGEIIAVLKTKQAA